MAEMKATISVEKIINTQLRTLAENIKEKYGLIIEDVHFDWKVVSKLGERALSGELDSVTTTIKG